MLDAFLHRLGRKQPLRISSNLRLSGWFRKKQTLNLSGDYGSELAIRNFIRRGVKKRWIIEGVFVTLGGYGLARLTAK